MENKTKGAAGLLNGDVFQDEKLWLALERCRADGCKTLDEWLRRPAMPGDPTRTVNAARFASAADAHRVFNRLCSGGNCSGCRIGKIENPTDASCFALWLCQESPDLALPEDGGAE